MTISYNINEWAIVSGTTARYLGRVVMHSGDIADPKARVDAIDEIGRRGLLITLDPCFEFAAMMRSQGGRTVREPLVCPVDFVVGGVPIHVKATMIYFCADMKDADKKTYSQIIDQGLEIMDRARVDQAGIALPPKGAGALVR